MWNRWGSDKSLAGRLLPLYLGVYVAFAASATTLCSLLDSSGPLIVALLLFAVSLGIGFKLSEWPGRRWIGLGSGVLIAALAVFATPIGDFSSTPVDTRAAFHLMWIVLILGCAACTADTILFLLVPSLAMLIAGAVGSVDDLITACALTYCIASLFVMLYHTSLRPVNAAAPAPGALRTMMLNGGTLACLTFMLTAILAVAASIPLQIGGNIIRPYVIGTVMPLGRSRRGAAGPATPVGTATGYNAVKVGQGPAQLTHDPVLRVQSRERHVLRSRVFTDYTGAGWRDVGQYPRPIPRRIPHGFTVHTDSYSARWPLVEQNIILLAPGNTLPAYAQIERLQVQGASPVWMFDSHGCARMLQPNSGPLAYTVVSHVAPDLNTISDGAPGPSPPDPTPPMVPSEVNFLASSLKGAGDVKTTQNIVRYLQARCTYDLNAPAVPADRDAVDFFIFGSRAGYCDLFATSAALLLQLNGIPARYCTGYLPGEWSEQHRAIVVTSAEAHAWVEVFIKGRGWITVDPTPPGFTGPPSASTFLRSLMQTLHLGQLSPNFPNTIAVLAVMIAAILIYHSLPGVRRKRAGKRLDLPEQQSALLMNYWRMEQLLRKAGLPRRSHETPLEYSQRLESSHLPQENKEAVSNLTRDFVGLRYGGKSQPDEHAGTVLELRRALRRTKRRCLWKTLLWR